MPAPSYRCLFALSIALLPAPALANTPYPLDGIVQFGTAADDVTNGIAVDPAGNVFVSGFTQGPIAGEAPGGFDAFVAKFDSAGNGLWIRQIDSPGGDDDIGYDIAVDSAGAAYITGATFGDIAGTNAGGIDAFVVKFDADGEVVYEHQFGTSAEEQSYAIAVDSAGSAYVAGYTEGGLNGPNAGLGDIFVKKLDANGFESWTTQLGGAGGETAYGIAVDHFGNAYVSGATESSLEGIKQGGQDSFLWKLNSNGGSTWLDQVGTPEDEFGNSVAVDQSGNAFVGGSTFGNFTGIGNDERDAFLIKYTSTGVGQWVKQFGTAQEDNGIAVDVDPNGDPFIVGFTEGDLASPNAGDQDAYLMKFASLDGDELWRQQFGTSADDAAFGVAINAAGDVYVNGPTRGSLGSMNEGERDAFLAKFVAFPALVGDFNADGDVNQADYLAWHNTYGDTVTPGTGADGNNDGMINAADYTVWRNRLAMSGAGAGIAAVPEPAAGVMLFLCLAIGVNCMQRIRA